MAPGGLLSPARGRAARAGRRRLRRRRRRGGEPAGGSGAAATPAADPCAKDQLALIHAGTLTVGTDNPAFPPYFEDDDPSNGKGFESAVAYAIADELGFDEAEVKWSGAVQLLLCAGPKNFDFDINQISITPAARRAVDFSEPYFTAPRRSSP